MTQYTSAPGDEGYQYAGDLQVRDVIVVYDPSLMACTHDYSCPVCRKNHAILSGKDGLMIPCWDCQELGFVLTKKLKQTWFQKLFGIQKYDT